MDVLARYGPLLDRAHWIEPVTEEPHHRQMVHDDVDDTMLLRVAEAVYTVLPELIAADQVRPPSGDVRAMPHHCDGLGPTL